MFKRLLIIALTVVVVLGATACDNRTFRRLNTMANLLRRHTVRPSTPQPAVLGGSPFTISTNNIINTTPVQAVNYTEQTCNLDRASNRSCHFDATLRYGGTGSAVVFGISVAAGTNSVLPTMPFLIYEVRVEAATGGARIKVNEGGALAFTDTVFDNATVTPRVRFLFRDNRVEVYRTFDANAGFGDVPLHRFAYAAISANDYRAWFRTDNADQVLNILVTNYVPSFTYRTTERNLHGGSPTVYMRVYQRSAIVGQGYTKDLTVNLSTTPVTYTETPLDF